jgi:hypothetical protein
MNVQAKAVSLYEIASESQRLKQLGAKMLGSETGSVFLLTL